ncbi:MAG: TatD family hydrolase [Lachnospiraceae bacterium]|jgi:TatD DNase family protein
MIFDTHAHYEDEAFDADREEILRLLPAGGIGAVTDVASSMETARKAVELAERFDFVYASVGAHPDSVSELSEESMDEFAEIAEKHPKVRAVGEIGLDYHWGRENAELQRKWFRRQLRLARELRLPVIIHSRDAAQETFDILAEEKAEEAGGVIHCYSGSAEMAEEYVRRGFYLGIGGVVTFKNARVIKEVVRRIPLTSLVLETDCPYMAPVPHRGERNSSLNLPFVVKAVCELKGLEREEVEDVTWNNAEKLYGLR